MCITKILLRFWWLLAFYSILMLFVGCSGSVYSDKIGASENNGYDNYNNINSVSESITSDANQCVSNDSDDNNEVNLVSECLPFDAAQIATNFIAGNPGNLLAQNQVALSSNELYPSSFIIKNGLNIIRLEEGIYKVQYGSQDVSPTLETSVTYTSGYQLIGFMDQDSNLTDDMCEVDFIGIENHDLSYNFWQDDVQYIVVVNGKLLSGGFSDGVDHVMSSTDFNINGYTSNGDTFYLTVPDLTVGFALESYPYPEAGQSERGTLVYDGKTYNYVTTYDGTKNAIIQVSGSYNALFNIDLSNGSDFLIEKN